MQELSVLSLTLSFTRFSIIKELDYTLFQQYYNSIIFKLFTIGSIRYMFLMHTSWQSRCKEGVGDVTSTKDKDI